MPALSQMLLYAPGQASEDLLTTRGEGSNRKIKKSGGVVVSGSEGLSEKLIPTNIKGYHSRKLALSRDISTVKNAHSPGKAMRGGRDSMKL